jgi:hypothetical protein
VLVTDLPETPDHVIHKLGLRFMKDHGEQLIDLGMINEDDFKPFEDIIKEILQEEMTIDESNLINPTRKFSSSELYELDESLQPTALAMIAIREGTVDQIAKESGLDKEATFQNINELQTKGLIGKKLAEGEITYFCSF